MHLDSSPDPPLLQEPHPALTLHPPKLLATVHSLLFSVFKIISRKHILPLLLGGSGGRSGRAVSKWEQCAFVPCAFYWGPREPPEALREKQKLRAKVPQQGRHHLHSLRRLLPLITLDSKGQPGAGQGTRKPEKGHRPYPNPCLYSERRERLRRAPVLSSVLFCSLCIFCYR